MTMTMHVETVFSPLNHMVSESDEDKNADSHGMVPEEYDVICGRSRLSQNHVGNRRFRALIEKNRVRYQTAKSRPEKTSITIELVEKIRQFRPGGRFLLLDVETGIWQDAGDAYAREKVSHALRSAKKHTKIRAAVASGGRKSRPQQIAMVEKEIVAKLIQDQQRVFQYLIQQDELEEDL